MEYRKRARRRRAYTNRSNSYFGTVICVIGLFAAIVYLIGVSSAGSWVAKHIVAPAFQTLGISDLVASNPERETAQTSTQFDLRTETLHFPAGTRYALQMGVYSSLENASKQAAALQALGAAGYICNTDGKYRVLAACYPDESSLSAVREQLTAEGLESAAYLFERAPTEWIVTASQSQIEVLQQAMQCLLDLSDRLYTVVYTFDSEQQQISVGQAAIEILKTELESYQASLVSDLGEGTDVSKQLKTCYDDILAAFEEALAYTGDISVEFSAKLKYVLLSTEDAICTFVSAVESAA